MIHLSDIAKRAKVSVATVSLALRNRPGVSARSRDRVMKIAREMGYRPNPLVSAYQTNVRRSGMTDYHGTLAWIDDAPANVHRLRDDPPYRDMHAGAAEQAEALGFKLEVIRLPELDPDQDAANKQRFERILKARGIPGAVFPQLWVARLLTYDWADISLASYGGNAGFVERRAKPGWEHLVYTHVLTDTYNDTRLTAHQLRALGYRRIGLVTSRYHEIGAGYRFSAGYYATTRENNEEPLPPFTIEEEVLSETVPKGFRSWLREHRPDAIITTLNHSRRWLVECGKDVPGDIGLAHPFLRATEAGWSGVQENCRLAGGMLVDAVVAQIYRNERGIPANPKVMLIPGHWRSGSTTRTPQKGQAFQPI